MGYIGVVEFLDRDRNDQLFARIRPLVLEGGEDVNSAAFPIHGLAIWFYAPAECMRKFFLFEVGEPGTVGQDRRQVITRPDVPREVTLWSILDMSRAGSITQVAAGLHAGGLDVGRGWQDGDVSCYIKATDGIVGPVSLQIDNHTARIIEDLVGPQRVSQPLYRLQDGARLIDYSGNLLLYRPHLVTIGEVDLRSDSNIIRSVIRAAQRDGSIQVTRAQLKQIVQLTREADAPPAESLLANRLERARLWLEKEEPAAKLLEEFRDDLRYLPELEALRAAAREVGRKEGLRDAEASVEEELRDRRAEAKRLGGEASTTQQALLQSEQRLAELEHAEAEAGTRLREALEKPAELLREVHLLKPFLVGGDSPRLLVPVLAEGFPWEVAESVHETREKLFEALEDRGLPDALSRALLGCFTAKVTPVLVGPYTTMALEHFAEEACGGRCLRVAVSPRMVEPGDIFGKVDPVSGVLLPHRSRALDFILQAAKAPNTPALLILEGANRAPAEALLLPLLEFAQSHGSLPLCHPGIIQRLEDRFEVTWPSSLLLAVTLIEGGSVLPLPSILWAHGALVDGAGFRPPADHGKVQKHEVDPALLSLQDPGCRAFTGRAAESLPPASSPLGAFRLSYERLGQALLEQPMTMVAVLEALSRLLTLPASLTLGLTEEAGMCPESNPRSLLVATLKRTLL